MTIDDTRQIELIATYRDGLLNNTLPFWTEYSVDREYGACIYDSERAPEDAETHAAYQRRHEITREDLRLNSSQPLRKENAP